MRNLKTMRKTQRKHTILEHLFEGKTVKKREFRELFERSCSERTIQRTIKELQVEGWPIQALNDGYFLARPNKTDLRQSNYHIIATFALAGCAIDKNLESFAPDTVQQIKKHFLKANDLPSYWDAEKRATDVKHIPFDENDLEAFGKLTRCVLNELPTTFSYRSIGKEESLQRTVFPIQLKEREGSWYLTAYDYDKEADRTFALKRLTNVTMPEDHYEDPSEEIINRNLSRGQFSIWDSGEAEAVQMEIRLVDYAAWIIQEHTIHPSQKLEVISPNEVILHLTTSDEIGVRLWLRKYAPFVEILSPVALREQYLRELQAGIDIHKPIVN